MENHLKYNKLNVIVKIQSYELKEGETYEGQFHQEGFKKEGIFMIAIYYFDISSNLKGGHLELKFVKNKNYDESQGCLKLEMETKKFQIVENDVAIFLNRRCEHRVSLLETYLPKPGRVYERKILAFFIADPQNSTIPTSKNMKINQKAPIEDKDQIYAKRDNFKTSRAVTSNNELDYSENEGDPNLIIREFSQNQENKESLNIKKNDVKNKRNPNDSCHLFIRSLAGKMYNVCVSRNAIVKQVKQSIYEQDGIPVDQQTLILKGKLLINEKPLTDYGIQEGETTLHMYLNLRGD